jgi:acetyl esterase/lipase
MGAYCLKSLALALLVGFLSAQSNAEITAWQPLSGYTQVPLWSGEIPSNTSKPGPEYTEVSKDLIGGKPVMAVHNVSVPTLTFYQAKGKNSGVTVVVFPGGGFEILAIDLEGTEVCDRLTSQGINCVLLKYRVPSLPYDWHSNSRPHNLMISTESLEDAQRALGLVRFHAKDWGIDPQKTGVLGFSAGGYLVAEISTNYKKRLYVPTDAADKESCRPDFAVGIYPGHLSMGDKTLKLNPNIKVTSETPPTFLVQAEDDYTDGINQSLVYYIALKDMRVPVEMHLFAQGGHAFGLRHTKLPISDWPDLMNTWLRTIGVIAQ